MSYLLPLPEEVAGVREQPVPFLCGAASKAATATPNGRRIRSPLPDGSAVAPAWTALRHAASRPWDAAARAAGSSWLRVLTFTALPHSIAICIPGRRNTRVGGLPSDRSPAERGRQRVAVSRGEDGDFRREGSVPDALSEEDVAPWTGRRPRDPRSDPGVDRAPRPSPGDEGAGGNRTRSITWTRRAVPSADG